MVIVKNIKTHLNGWQEWDIPYAIFLTAFTETSLHEAGNKSYPINQLSTTRILIKHF